MKLTYRLLIIFGVFFISQNSNAQLLDRIARKTQKKIEREAENRAQKRIDKGIDDAYDGVEDGIDGKGKEDKKSSNKSNSSSNDNSSNDAKNDNNSAEENNDSEKTEKNKTPELVWNNFDFIPGDTVIFEDGPSIDEENGEFPSRWDLKQGVAEIVEVDGEKVIMEIGGIDIVPYLENPEEDYLPEVFTVEADVYYYPGYSHRFYVSLYDEKNQRYGENEQITFYVNSANLMTSTGKTPGKERGNSDEFGGWRHISIAYTKGKVKIYIDQHRLVNIPHYPGNPTGITFGVEGYSSDTEHKYIKNIRIAKGGVKYYDRFLSDGKIIVNGIKFDVNKATLKPESMGPINKIFKLMVKNTDVNFSVEGHTDSDGSEETNQTLSVARAQSVMDKLIEMGIDKSRLKFTGFGESKPLDNNTTPEGKANNRRVEFVKF